MPQKRYLVTLTPEERQRLADLLSAGKRSALTLTRARILLKADQADGGPAWPTTASPRRWTVVCVPSSGSANASSNAAWRRPWAANPKTAPAANASSTGGPRPGSSPWPARSRPTAGRPGRCNCWPTSWSSCGSWTPSATKRCDACSKKRDQAVAEGAVVHPAGGRR